MPDVIGRVCRVCDASLSTERHGRICPDCKRAADRAYYRRNRDRMIAAATRWQTENRERKAEIGRRYKQRNKTRISEKMREYHAARYIPRQRQTTACVDCGLEITKVTNIVRCADCRPKAATKRNNEYRRRNPAKAADFGHRRRVRKKGNGEFVVAARDWRRMLERYRYRCAYCGGQGPLTQEHVIPISRGGRHSIGNLLPVCGPCNYSKNFRLLVEWRAKRRLAA